MDICSKCKGLWLDKNEYQEIVSYLAGAVNSQSVGDYLKDVREEFVEVFVGPEGPLRELSDLDRVLYLLELRFIVEHPRLAAFLGNLPR